MEAAQAEYERWARQMNAALAVVGPGQDPRLWVTKMEDYLQTEYPTMDEARMRLLNLYSVTTWHQRHQAQLTADGWTAPGAGLLPALLRCYWEMFVLAACALDGAGCPRMSYETACEQFRAIQQQA